MYYVPSVLASKKRSATSSFCGIEFYWAKIGHGKTHHVLRSRLLPALKEGRHVYTNIDFGGPLKVQDIEVFSEEMRAGMILSDYLGKDVRHLFHIVTGDWVRLNISLGASTDSPFTAVPPGSRIILDEVQNIFPLGGFKTAPEGFFRFLCKCRHFDVDFVFISQNTALVDKRIISTASDFIKIKNGGFLSSMFSKGYRVTHHQSQYDFEGYTSSVHKFDPDVFSLYQSSNTIVKHKRNGLPPFVTIPLVAVACWALFFGFKAHKSALWSGRSQKTLEVRAGERFTPPPATSIPPKNAPSPLVNPDPAPPQTSAGRAIAYLTSMSDWRDAVASTPTARWSYRPPRPYTPRFRDGVEVFGN